MQWLDYLGIIAGLFTTGSLVPQLIRIFQLRSAHEISLLYNSLFLLGVVLWMIYGIYFGLFPVIFWNAAGAVLGAVLLYAKLKYGRK